MKDRFIQIWQSLSWPKVQQATWSIGIGASILFSAVFLNYSNLFKDIDPTRKLFDFFFKVYAKVQFGKKIKLQKETLKKIKAENEKKLIQVKILSSSFQDYSHNMYDHLKDQGNLHQLSLIIQRLFSNNFLLFSFYLEQKLINDIIATPDDITNTIVKLEQLIELLNQHQKALETIFITNSEDFHQKHKTAITDTLIAIANATSELKIESEKLKEQNQKGSRHFSVSRSDLKFSISQDAHKKPSPIAQTNLMLEKVKAILQNFTNKKIQQDLLEEGADLILVDLYLTLLNNPDIEKDFEDRSSSSETNKVKINKEDVTKFLQLLVIIIKKYSDASLKVIKKLDSPVSTKILPELLNLNLEYNPDHQHYGPISCSLNDELFSEIAHHRKIFDREFPEEHPLKEWAKSIISLLNSEFEKIREKYLIVDDSDDEGEEVMSKNFTQDIKQAANTYLMKSKKITDILHLAMQIWEEENFTPLRIIEVLREKIKLVQDEDKELFQKAIQLLEPIVEEFSPLATKEKTYLEKAHVAKTNLAGLNKALNGKIFAHKDNSDLKAYCAYEEKEYGNFGCSIISEKKEIHLNKTQEEELSEEDFQETEESSWLQTHDTKSELVSAAGELSLPKMYLMPRTEKAVVLHATMFTNENEAFDAFVTNEIVRLLLEHKEQKIFILLHLIRNINDVPFIFSNSLKERCKDIFSSKFSKILKSMQDEIKSRLPAEIIKFDSNKHKTEDVKKTTIPFFANHETQELTPGVKKVVTHRKKEGSYYYDECLIALCGQEILDLFLKNHNSNFSPHIDCCSHQNDKILSVGELGVSLPMDEWSFIGNYN